MLCVAAMYRMRYYNFFALAVAFMCCLGKVGL